MKLIIEDDRLRESYVSYIGALYQESTLWDTGRKTTTWAIVEGLMLDIVLENTCLSYDHGIYSHYDGDDLCAMCKDFMRDLIQALECARAVHSDLLKERGLHWKPFGEHVHLSNAYHAYYLGAFIATQTEFIEKMHQLAMKDFSLQP